MDDAVSQQLFPLKLPDRPLRLSAYHMPGRVRSVPLRNGRLLRMTFPDLWLVHAPGLAHITSYVTTLPPLPSDNYAWTGTWVCFGEAKRAVRLGDLGPVEAFWMTSCSGDTWRAYADGTPTVRPMSMTAALTMIATDNSRQSPWAPVDTYPRSL